MKEHTLDEAIIEAARFLKAAKQLRAYRRAVEEQGHLPENTRPYGRLHATVERGALDCRYKLADLRAGR